MIWAEDVDEAVSEGEFDLDGGEAELDLTDDGDEAGAGVSDAGAPAAAAVGYRYPLGDGAVFLSQVLSELGCDQTVYDVDIAGAEDLLRVDWDGSDYAVSARACFDEAKLTVTTGEGIVCIVLTDGSVAGEGTVQAMPEDVAGEDLPEDVPVEDVPVDVPGEDASEDVPGDVPVVDIPVVDVPEDVPVVDITKEDSGNYTVSITGLPKYKPQETASDGGEELEYFLVEDTSALSNYTVYPVDGKTPESGTLTNTRRTATLTLKKAGIVSDLAADDASEKAFGFNISSDPAVTGSYACTIDSDPATSGNLDFDENGVASGQIQLKKGQRVVITGLPVGVTYTVKEVETGDVHFTGA